MAKTGSSLIESTCEIFGIFVLFCVEKKSKDRALKKSKDSPCLTTIACFDFGVSNLSLRILRSWFFHEQDFLDHDLITMFTVSRIHGQTLFLPGKWVGIPGHITVAAQQ